jgi:hypothetical protein
LFLFLKKDCPPQSNTIKVFLQALPDRKPPSAGWRGVSEAPPRFLLLLPLKISQDEMTVFTFP